MFDNNMDKLGGRMAIPIPGKIKRSLVDEIKLIGNERDMSEVERISLISGIKSREGFGGSKNTLAFGIFAVLVISGLFTGKRDGNSANVYVLAGAVIFVGIIAAFLIFKNAKTRDVNGEKLKASERGSYGVYDLDIVEKFTHKSGDDGALEPYDYYILCRGICFKVDSRKYASVHGKIAVVILYCDGGIYLEVM